MDKEKNKLQLDKFDIYMHLYSHHHNQDKHRTSLQIFPGPLDILTLLEYPGLQEYVLCFL